MGKIILLYGNLVGNYGDESNYPYGNFPDLWHIIEQVIASDGAITTTNTTEAASHCLHCNYHNLY